jgi:hypothetical protein
MYVCMYVCMYVRIYVSIGYLPSVNSRAEVFVINAVPAEPVNPLNMRSIELMSVYVCRLYSRGGTSIRGSSSGISGSAGKICLGVCIQLITND